MSSHHEIVIVGTGFSGLGMAIQLRRDGMRDFVILERADDLGGTWRDNSYPGCACDVPSLLYSWSDEPNPDWSRVFAPAAEIWDYMRDVAVRHDVIRHIRYGHDMLHAAWDDDDQLWRIETNQGEFTAEVLVSGVGALTEPAIPELAGLERFTGTMFHSARWDHGHDMRGRRVAVIGTGASAMQFVPEIQPQVERLHVFQRTPGWVIPRMDAPVPDRLRALFRRAPITQRALRQALFGVLEARQLMFRHPRLMALNEKLALRHLERQVPDPELRAKLTPTFRMGCKRIMLSDTWYPAVTADNAELVTAGIREVVPDGIVDADGVHHAVDTIVFGTGFHVTDSPIYPRVRGRDGRTLGEVWQGSPQAYLGTSVAGFPNLFLLLGPGTGLGHNSVVLMIEAQCRYVRDALALRREHDLASIEPTPAAQRAFVAEVDRALEGSVWTSGGCKSWYLDSTGRASTLWPRTVIAFDRRLKRFVPHDHRLEGRRPRKRRPEPAVEPVAA